MKSVFKSRLEQNTRAWVNNSSCWGSPPYKCWESSHFTPGYFCFRKRRKQYLVSWWSHWKGTRTHSKYDLIFANKSLSESYLSNECQPGAGLDGKKQFHKDLTALNVSFQMHHNRIHGSAVWRSQHLQSQFLGQTLAVISKFRLIPERSKQRPAEKNCLQLSEEWCMREVHNSRGTEQEGAHNWYRSHRRLIFSNTAKVMS